MNHRDHREHRGNLSAPPPYFLSVISVFSVVSIFFF
jgi:hypothetical protein